MNKNIFAYEVNFDGIVGPTHNYSGLSYGNIASKSNQAAISNPREAALQGLAKMKFLADLGIKQAVLPPHERPHIPTLRSLGFQGDDSEILKTVATESPELLQAILSSAAMWVANAATICPSSDSHDKKVHFTPANLSSKFHRSIEFPTTQKILKKVFPGPNYFVHHDSLPAGTYFSDEGAANHNRFCRNYGTPGVQLFIYGRYAFKDTQQCPKKFPARQSYEASQAIARRHGISTDQLLFAQQNPEAIDAGAFHNDVVAVSNGPIFFFHENAYLQKNALLQTIQNKVEKVCGCEAIFIEVKEKDISLEDAVRTYLFNSQILTLPNGKMTLIAPTECQENQIVQTYIQKIIEDKKNPIDTVHYLNLRQSMKNGGGPACLRLRVVLTPDELKAAHPNVFLDDALYLKLTEWVKKHYRDHLQLSDLADPQLLNEGHQALDELTAILKLGPIYPFQLN